jgi:hypothetical protein
MDATTRARPKAVAIAAYLVWIALAVTLAEALIQDSHRTPFDFSFVAISVAVFSVPILLVYMIWRRHNWARITFAALMVIGMYFTIPEVIASWEGAPFASIGRSAIAALQLVGLYLLFSVPSNAWFKRRQSQL